MAILIIVIARACESTNDSLVVEGGAVYLTPSELAIADVQHSRWILLPGTLCNSDVFDDFLDCVGVEKANRRAVTLKYTEADCYLAELKELLCPGTMVCGFSLGAIVAAHLADRLDVSALVLFGLNPYAHEPAKAQDRLELQKAVRAGGGRAGLEPRLPRILAWTIHETPNSFTEPFSRSEFCEGVVYRLYFDGGA